MEHPTMALPRLELHRHPTDDQSSCFQENIDTDFEVATAWAVTTNHPLPGTLKATIRAHIDSEKEQLVSALWDSG